MMLQNIPVEDAGNMVLDQTKEYRLIKQVTRLFSASGCRRSLTAKRRIMSPSEIGPESRWTWEMIHLPSFILLLTVMRDELPAKIMKPEV